LSIGESRQDSLFTYVAGYPYYGCVPGIDELDSY
jgi:hypothetical protein